MDILMLNNFFTIGFREKNSIDKGNHTQGIQKSAHI
jgi:hypothetical protein